MDKYFWVVSIMDNSYYFELLNEEIKRNVKLDSILGELKSFSDSQKRQVYVIDKPVGERKYQYEYKEAIIILIPKVKIIVLDIGEQADSFNDFLEDFVEDLGYISDKYEYKSFLGRPRKWREELIIEIENISNLNVSNLIHQNTLSELNSRKGELLISLLTGSINEIDRVKGDVPTSSLEQIKKNIILFDGEQTRFIFEKQDKDRVTIQGLAGTGKTELLLHKLKDLYVNEIDSKIFFTCYSTILAKDLKERIPNFFDFMKVEEQIKWNDRLWIERSWGSQKDKNSGVYSFVCNHYDIPFQRYSWSTSFEDACNNALSNLDELEEKGNFEPFFDYILIDESQDFNEAFFKLCEKVTKKQVYIAGDIFQNIYDYNSLSGSKPDFLLNRVYRTDPKTLMFAHAIGFGLLERPVVRWLSDEEWLACGYTIEKNEEDYSFSREPLNRFENLEEEIPSIKLAATDKNGYLTKVLNALHDIKASNPTVEASDIGVVFLENNDLNYELVENLIIKIDQQFGWSSVKGYEIKNKQKDSLFISNRNNIKGLEFPFIICITTTPLDSNTTIRNSLYMMLTRSFITSYLILSSDNGSVNQQLFSAAKEIEETGKLTVKKPKPSEVMDKSKLMLEANTSKSQYDIIEEILKKFEVRDRERKNQIHKLVQVMLKESVDVDKINALIQKNIDFI